LHISGINVPLPLFSERTILRILVCVTIFIATNTADYAVNIRLSISNGCCASKPVIVLSETEKGSLSSFEYFNFSFMERTMKNYGKVKDSNLTVTPDCESVSNQLNLLPKSEQNLNRVNGDDNVAVIGGNANENEINSQSVGETQGEGILGNNVESSNIQNGTNLSSQTNHADTNTGTAIFGTGHTIYNYACPPEIIELISKLVRRGGAL
jgi:hypothetical protein